MAVLSSLPVGHVIKVLCELCQVGTLLFILFFCPKQNFWDLPRKERREVGKHNTLKWDFYPKIPSCSLCSQISCVLQSSRCQRAGREYQTLQKVQTLPQPILISVPRFYRRVQHPAGSAARLFHDCGNHAVSLACGKQRGSCSENVTCFFYLSCILN